MAEQTRTATAPDSATAPHGATSRDGAPVSRTETNGDLTGVAEDMVRNRAAHDANTYHELLAEETPEPPLAETPELPPMSMVVSGASQVIAALPAEMAPPIPAPGLTERGWSPEVTARHPELLLAAMEELAASETVTHAGGDPIDPTDPVAVEGARRALGRMDVIKNNLRVDAARLNNERLSAALGAVASRGLAVQAAVQDAVEEMKAAVHAATAPDSSADATHAPASASSSRTARSGERTSGERTGGERASSSS